jgi:hypothetical protein
MKGPYKVIYCGLASIGEIAEFLNRKYAEGFELICFSDGIFIFKEQPK